MYYLAIFIDYHPFFRSKLKHWLSNQKKYTCTLIDAKGNHEIIPISNLLECNVENLYYYHDESWYSRYDWNWCIHGKQERDFHVSNLPCVLALQSNQKCNISLNEFDEALSLLADKYQWAILPWSNYIRLRSFIFISKDRQLRDKFVNCSENKIIVSSLSNKKCNLLVNTSDINIKFTQSLQAIIFQENINTVGDIWDILNLDSFPPLLFTNINIRECYNIPSHLYKHKVVKCADEKNNFDWNTYQPVSKISFQLISGKLINDKNIKTAFWIPRTTDLDKFRCLLIDTESKNTSYSDLSYLQDFDNICDWLYGFSRDFDSPEEYNYSIFASTHSPIIEEIDAFRQERSSCNFLADRNYYYKLLACF